MAPSPVLFPPFHYVTFEGYDKTLIEKNKKGQFFFKKGKVKKKLCLTVHGRILSKDIETNLLWELVSSFISRFYKTGLPS
jgi:hypothetical protein